jgi:uncharacterized protein YggU (UPF0235/DUF167 family)
VRTKPGARHSRLTPGADGDWLAEVRAAPVSGQANAELIDLVAKHFGCTKARVSIKCGARGRIKLIRIAPA